MANKWSNEYETFEFKEPNQATAMAVDAQGQMAVLAGRRSLEIVNLDDPASRIRIRRKSTVKWDVNVAEWSPHESPNQFATAANQVVDIFTRKEGDWIQENALKAHTRAVSDLNWAPFEHDLLATCSVDTYIFLWDMRAPKKPSASFSTFAGAGQVKWNKKNLNYFATVHEGDIRLWDKRKSGGQAIQYVSAHLAKIHGLDWDPNSEFSLATASQDCTAKFWNILEARKPTLELRSSSPVWRARYTPFGDGILTTSVPQLRRGENTLLLWTCSNLSSPVHSFPGHTDDILEFQWRQLHDDSMDYQLITWCRDQSLRMWRVEPHLQRLCGVDIPEGAGSEESTIIDVITPTTTQETGSPISPDGKDGKSPSSSQTEVVTVATQGSEVERSMEDDDQGSSLVYQHQQQVILEDEFNVLSRNQQNVSIEQLDARSRTCLLSAIGGQHTIRIKAVFPMSYPNKVPPKWSFLLMTSLDGQLKSKLLKVLDEICNQQVASNQYCLQMCLQHLDTFVESLKGSKSPSKKMSSQSMKSVTGAESSGLMANYGTFTDYNIPFPRTTGARFSGVDKLVIFTRQGSSRKTGNNLKTPRSLTALGSFNKPFFAFGQRMAQPVVDEPVSLSSFYKDRERKQRRSSKHRRKESDPNLPATSSKTSQSCGPVVVYDASYFLPIHQDLAASYVLNPHDIPTMCTKNAAVARAVGRRDLVQMWSLAAVSSNQVLRYTENPDYGAPWAKHPFGRQLLKSLLDHYSSIHDVQTLAMLCCVFGSLYNQQQKDNNHDNELREVERGYVAIESNMYFVTDGSDPIFTQDWSGDNPHVQSFSESPDDYRLNPMRDPEDIEREKHRYSTKLLDPNLSHQYDAFKRHYAEILYRWKLLRARAEILNYVSVKSLHQSEIVFSDFGIYCQRCSKKVYTVKCDSCRSFSFQCSICHVAVKGSSSFCLVCGHGGHSLHMMEWFKHESVCPTGCGCMCPQQSKQMCEDAPLSPR